MTDLNLREIPFEDIEILWNLDYYDGVLSGICRYNNKKYYFSIIDQNEDIIKAYSDKDIKVTWYRKFALYELSIFDMSYEVKKHRCFEIYVSQGDDNDCSFLPRKYFPKQLWNKFYDKFTEEKEYEKKYNPIAFFLY